MKIKNVELQIVCGITSKLPETDKVEIAFAGKSNVGKSSLINQLQDSVCMETGSISEKIERGKHTTRHSEIIPLEEDAYIMDTPGFSALDFNGISKEEIRNAFREFRNYPCPFKDCMHTKEKECRVKEAVLENNILESRYKNYLSFLGEERI